jgi:hypothetical protein
MRGSTSPTLIVTKELIVSYQFSNMNFISVFMMSFTTERRDGFELMKKSTFSWHGA